MRRSALRRTRADVPGESFAELEHADEEHTVDLGEAGESIPEPGPVESVEPEFAELTPPPEEPRRGRLLGGSRDNFQRPAHLKEYSETVIIGENGPIKPAPQASGGASPEAMQQTMHEQGMDQTMAAPAQPQAPPPPAIDKEIIAKAEAEAEQMVQQAEMRAQQILNEAVAQAQQQAQIAAEQARQEAGQQGYQEGYQAGVAEGRQAGQIELQQLIHAVKFQFIDMVKLRRKLLVDMEPEIVRLSWEIAKRVVGEELKTNREVIVGVVRSSLYTLQERDEILIRVNPSEYETVKAHQSEFEAMIEGLRKFTVQPDGAIEPGSCAIETNLGNVDARIDTQFEAIRLGLEEMSKIRQFEMNDQLAAQPVEVPGDPEFESRMREQNPPHHQGGHGHGEAHGHGGGHGHGEEEQYEQEEYQGEEQQEMELLPEPTPEILSQFSPEDQARYIEMYNQQQAYLEELQRQMMAEQEGE